VYAPGAHRQLPDLRQLDVLRRTLRHQEGYAMHHVMNFTDVDDKTIKASTEAGVSLRSTDRYVAAFHEDAAAMGLEPVEENPRAT
jgi:cysteinyl-tRNA synthetase